jgi:LCP family protein required for cell wall assembly
MAEHTNPFATANELSLHTRIDNQNNTKPKRKLKIGKVITVVLLLLAIAIFSFGGIIYASGALRSIGKITGEEEGGVFGGLFSNFTSVPAKLFGQEEGRTNILIVGEDSVAKLSDSIIIMSYFYDTKKFTTISLPRDLLVGSKYGGPYKINSIYAFAEQVKERSGAPKLARIIEEEWGLKMHYWATMNFEAVRDIITAVGGVEVDVPNGFTDCEYPRDDYSGTLPCQTFTKGVTQMDGTKALIYARSRHGNNGEGSDFKRSQRQAVIIESLIKKMKKQQDVFALNKYDEYLNIMSENLKTSVKSYELKRFYDTFFKQITGGASEAITKINIDNSTLSSTGSSILCDNNEESVGYYLGYCNGSGVGAGSSKYRDALTELLKNPLPEPGGISNQLKSASSILLGNQSQKYTEILTDLKQAGMKICSDCGYNAYQYAEKAGLEGKIYISNSELKKEFEEKIAPKLKLKYTIESTIPSSKYLTPNNQGTDIIVWIE